MPQYIIHLAFSYLFTLVTDEQETEPHCELVDGKLQPIVETSLHLNTKYSELIYVLEGGFAIYTDTRIAVVHKGESIFIIKNTPHVVAATTIYSARKLAVVSHVVLQG